jgi:hypothetical protein
LRCLIGKTQLISPNTSPLPSLTGKTPLTIMHLKTERFIIYEIMFFIIKAVFSEIVAFRTQTNSRIKYGFRALFLSKQELTLKKLVAKTVKIQMPIFTILANSNKVYEKSHY